MFFFHLFSSFSVLSRELLLWCVRLSGLLLTAALLSYVWADAAGCQVALLCYYGRELTGLALIPLAAGLIGMLLLEDILRHQAP